VGAGAAWLWGAWQRAEQERAVNGYLREVERELEAWKRPEAETAMGRAEARLAGGGPAGLRRRVEQMREDLDLVDALDRIRLQAATVVDGKLDSASADRGYAALFRERGLAVEGEDEAVVADRVQGSAVRAQLVAALDDWASATRNLPRRAWLLEAARRAEPGPWADRFRDPAVWRDRAALENLAGDARAAELSPQLLTALAWALGEAGADPVPFLTAAQARHPADFWLNFLLGNALRTAKPEDAVGYYRAALALRPETSVVYNNLGNALVRKRDLTGAIAAYHRAIAIDPEYAHAHYNLGVVLKDKGDAEGAIAAYRRAIAIDPRHAHSYTNLGVALAEKGDVEGSIAAHRKAVAVDANDAEAHFNLGTALAAKGWLDEAIREYRRAIDLKHDKALTNLGAALEEKGDPEGAIAAYRRAVALNPRDAKAHNNLGNALLSMGRTDEAVQEFQTAIAIDRGYAVAHYNLGNALKAQDRLGDATQAYRRAIALAPRLALAHGALGLALLRQGEFGEARVAIRRCLDLLPRDDPQRQLVSRQLRQCERWLALNEKLPHILEGKTRPADTAERLDLAQMCQQYKQLYAASARFYAEAFSEQPRPAEDLQAAHGYNAACAAALAAAGRGKDADKLGGQGRALLRKQALGWLRADLARWRKLVDGNKPQAGAAAQEALQQWQKDPDLAGLRDPEAVAKLPEAERVACRELWADVAALLQRARGKD
jgi:tetratricopeptide (TPR) repeat protein